MQNYARDSSYFAELLLSLEANYTILKDWLSKTGLSTQTHERYAYGTHRYEATTDSLKGW